MPKTPITKSDLAHLFRERMDQNAECPRDVQVRIMRIKTSSGLGWTAVTSQADTLAHIDCARFVGALTIELKEDYELLDE